MHNNLFISCRAVNTSAPGYLPPNEFGRNPGILPW
jgi:hypothetical protein